MREIFYAGYRQATADISGSRDGFQPNSAKVGFASGVNVMEAFHLLPDPQTNGGLLVSVAPNSVDEVTAVFERFGLSAYCQPIGKMVAKGEKVIQVH